MPELDETCALAIAVVLIAEVLSVPPMPPITGNLGSVELLLVLSLKMFN